MKFQETKDLKMFTTMLKFCGLWKYSSDTKNYKLYNTLEYLRLSLILILIIGWNWSLFGIIGYQNALKTSYTAYVIGGNYLYIQIIYLVYKRDAIVSFIELYTEIVKKRNSLSDIDKFQSMTEKTWKGVWLCFTLTFILVVNAFLYGLLYDIFLVILDNSSEVFYKPMPLEGFLPEKKVRDFTYYFVIFFNLFICLIIGVQYNGLHSILPVAITYISAEMKIIRKNLFEWSITENGPHRRDMLRQIINDHNQIFKLLQVLKSFIGVVYAIQNMLAPMVLTLLLLAAQKAIKNGGDTNLSMTMSVNTLVSANVMFMSCYFGEMLRWEGVKLSRALLMITWYKENAKVRQDLVLITLATQKPLLIDFKGKLPLTLRYFGQMMNSSYSYFMLLNTVS